MVSKTTKILFIDDFGSSEAKDLRLKVFPHPKDGNPVVFASDGQYLYELQTVQPRKYGCWFINQRVSSDDSFLLASKLDMCYLCLPFIRKAAGRFSPIDQILSPLNSYDTLSFTDAVNWNLGSICDINDELGDDLILYKYNELKTLEWLKRRVDSTAKTVSKQRHVKITQDNSLTSKSFNLSAQSEAVPNIILNEVSSDDIIGALQLISDYLDDDLSKILLKSYGYDSSVLTSKTVSVKRKADWESQLEIEKETVAYTQPVAKTQNKASSQGTNSISAKKPTASAKSIKPVQGAQSITSFFAKKS